MCSDSKGSLKIQMGWDGKYGCSGVDIDVNVSESPHLGL